VTAAEVQPLRVAIDARIPYGAWGGVQQVVEGLATGFAKLDGPEEYFFLVEGGGTEWLGPLIGRNSRAVKVPADFGRTAPRRLYDALMRGSPLVARVAQGAASRLGGASLQLPRSTGFVEGLGVDLVHFATPQAYLTKLPSIYQPHDLLYRSFPEQFAPVHARYRDHAYRAFSARASVVAVMTEFGRHEVLQAYGLPADRVAVVPWAPVAGPGRSPTSAEAIPGDLPERFVLYPAQTWPHKNHVRLLEALAALREKGLVIPLVSTGRQTGHMAEIRRRIDQLRLADQVRFLGFLPPKDFDAVLARSTAVVFPSLFEGWGLPVVPRSSSNPRIRGPSRQRSSVSGATSQSVPTFADAAQNASPSSPGSEQRGRSAPFTATSPIASSGPKIASSSHRQRFRRAHERAGAPWHPRDRAEVR
jgi:glycosyltransferase involved in cell wall biosynthesis